MKLNTRLSVASVMAAGLVLPGALVGAESAVASPAPASSASATPVAAKGHSAGKLIAHIRGWTSNHRHVKGTFVPQRFTVDNGQLMVTGVMRGVITGHGKPRHFSVTKTVPVKAVNGMAMPARGSAATTAARTASTGAGVANAAASCPILRLNLGPLDLDLLGLQVHLNRVVLNVTAQSGPGNLLGNLLCSVAGLLDNGGPLSGLLGQLSDLLNQILGALGGLPTAA